MVIGCKSLLSVFWSFLCVCLLDRSLCLLVETLSVCWSSVGVCFRELSVCVCRSSLLSTLQGRHAIKLPRKGELTSATMILVSEEWEWRAVMCGSVLSRLFLGGAAPPDCTNVPPYQCFRGCCTPIRMMACMQSQSVLIVTITKQLYKCKYTAMVCSTIVPNSQIVL